MKKRVLLLTSALTLCIIAGSCKEQGVTPPVTTAGTTVSASVTSSGTAEKADDAEDAAEDTGDLRELEWGMSVDEAKQKERAALAGEDAVDINGASHDLLIYDNVPYRGHSSQMTLYFGSSGLDRISYKINGEEYETIWQLRDEMIDLLSVEYDGTGFMSDEWVSHCEDKGVTVMTAPFDGNVICSFMPLMSEDEREALQTFVFDGGVLDEHGGHAVEPLLDMTEPEYDPEDIEGDPLDSIPDPEKVMLDLAYDAQKAFMGFLPVDSAGDAYELGKPEQVPGFPASLGAAPVISDKYKTIDDIKAELNKTFYSKYTDRLMWLKYGEAGGKLYALGGVRGGIRDTESWYLGCDIYDDRIVGHFALLGYIDEPDDMTDPDILNNTEYYSFYDITVRNVEGGCRITDVRGLDDKDWDHLEEHALFWNVGIVDRTLITNEALKPKN